MYKVFGPGLMPEKTFRSPEHTHVDHCEIIYYLEGKGKFKIGEKFFDFKSGDILFVPPGVPHHGVSKTGFRNITCAFYPYDEVGTEFFAVHDSYDQDFKQLIFQMLHNSLACGDDYELINSALVSVMIAYMNAWKKQTYKSNTIDVCERILIANIAEHNFTVDKLAQEVSLSKVHLNRIFKSATGFTLNAFLYEKRMGYAAHLLSDTHWSLKIKEIAAMCGYSNPYHFSMVFKQKYGAPPEEWRKLNQEDTPVD